MLDRALNRRAFLAGAAASVFGGARTLTAQRSGWRLGCQSYSFRQFDLDGAVANVKELGLDAIELYGAHLPRNLPARELGARLARVRSSGVDIVSYGVVGFDGGPEDRKILEFARKIGVRVLSANPEPESLDPLEDLAEELEIEIAIHNHGKGFLYEGAADVARAVAGRNRWIGACVDTGHALRYGDDPAEFVRRLGERVHSLHLKDWVHGGAEQLVGEGDLDLEGLAAALDDVRFSGPLMLEYEEHPDSPVPHMARGVANWRRASA